jgi:serine-type D-Ala-D-Ala carboxypeptidase/endopeptidase (penicillin-binding protein 4)
LEIPAAIDTPPMFAGDLLATQLDERGIKIGGEDAYPREAVALIGPADQYTESRVIAVITTPLEDVLERTNTDSHNLYAEALMKRIGHEITSDPGSWENGATVIRMLLAEKLGAGAAESTVISDGSGMCRDNRVAPKTMANWIRKLSRSEHWEMFRDSLATPGDGTLRKRFGDDALESDLHAKSGYLTGMYSLSGVLVHPRSGQRVVFSIMLNDVKSGGTSRNAKPLVDSIVEEIDEWMSVRAGSRGVGG